MTLNTSHTNGNRSFTFPKKEKITSKTLIDRLFKEGSSAHKYPVRMLFLTEPSYQEEFPQILISVSKRHFKHAVDRNHVKRIIREAYRLQKQELMEQFPVKPSYIAILYTSNEKISLEEMKKKLSLIIKKSISNTTD